MYDIIVSKLKEIETNENVRILYAAESGSRAWGFASTDSDYDVRFIYVRKKDDYLRVNDIRDVLEYPINDELDINGWDLKKTLQLLHKSNPTLFEWFSSPIVYIETDFSKEFKKTIPEYFSSKKGLYHYISMAESNYRDYLKTPMVKAKKYFYVLRPFLAAMWILDKSSPPPIRFNELVNSELDPKLKPTVDDLLELKMNHPETKEIPRIEKLNQYLDDSILKIKQMMELLPSDTGKDWDELNRLFLKTLNNVAEY